MDSSPKNIDKEMLMKLLRFCGYQERSKKEIIDKLVSLNIRENHEDYLEALIEMNAFNEDRFCDAFVRGKLNQRNWGRVKIKHHLNKHQISAASVNNALEQVNEEDYLQKILQLAQAKNESVSNTNLFERRHKISIYLINKGFEPNLVWDVLKEHIQE